MNSVTKYRHFLSVTVYISNKYKFTNDTKLKKKVLLCFYQFMLVRKVPLYFIVGVRKKSLVFSQKI